MTVPPGGESYRFRRADVHAPEQALSPAPARSRRPGTAAVPVGTPGVGCRIPSNHPGQAFAQVRSGGVTLA